MVWLDEGGLGRNRARLLAPPARLAPWIEHFWIQNGNGPFQHRSWRIVPDASAHIIFAVESRIGSKERMSCHVVGSRAAYIDIDVSPRLMTIGARLRPGALPALTRSHSAAFTDRAFRTEDVFGRAGRALADRMSLSTPDLALDHLRSFLDERLTRVEPDLRLGRALRTAPSVASLAEATGVSLRGIWNSTTEKTGLGPRRLLRIIRLHRALRRAAIPGAKWSEIAYASGYADQAHMVREFVSLLGESPNAWRNRGRADSFNTNSMDPVQS
jgi:AraC-like DNA-binding protein